MVQAATRLGKTRASAAVILLALTGGCAGPHSTDPVESSFSVNDVLGRCGAVYAEARTLRARGLLRDYRGKTRRAVNIAWDFARPDRCRLQIELEAALVVGDRWWTYDQTEQRYRPRSQFTRTPIETAAYMLSDGVPFLLPALLTRGERAFGGGRTAGFGGWRLEGVQWHAERPCYVVSRLERGREGIVLRVWIDQDRYVVRGWALSWPKSGSGDGVLVGCSYYDVKVNEPLPLDRFALKPPQPIELSLPGPGENKEWTTDNE